ncbi:MAG: hypothetical protein OXG98_00925 [Gemmatimonadetes bacterium]|nr:hypothetical protein [Gemmatimonadota bacterium]
MAELSWFQRNGAIFSGILAFIALLTYLHVSISEIGAETSGLRREIREDLKEVRFSLDRVETKVDEVRGYLRYNADTTNSDGPPADMKK